MGVILQNVYLGVLIHSNFSQRSAPQVACEAAVVLFHEHT